MSKTLEETKAYIIWFGETHKVNEKSITTILENIETDENGTVPDIEYYEIIRTLAEIDNSRNEIINNLKIAKKLRDNRERGR